MTRARTRSHPCFLPPRAEEAVRRVCARTLGDRFRVAKLERRSADAVWIGLEGPRALRFGVVWSEAAGGHYAAHLDAASGLPPATRTAAHRTVQALAGLTRPGLLTRLTEVAAGSEPVDVHLDPESITPLLETLVSEDHPLPAGFRVASVDPTSDHALRVRLASPAGTPHLDVLLAAADRDGLYVSNWFSLSHLPGEGLADTEAARLVFALGMRLEAVEAAIRVHPPRTSQNLSLPDDGPLDTFQASISAPCGQACSFCCLSVVEREARADADANRFLEGIRQAATRGAWRLRINGVEPLAAPWAVDLIEEAQARGFTEIELKSSCRPLADPAMADRVMGALRVRYRIDVPLYGSTAAVHDRVVGRPGAFEDMMVVLANVRDRLSEEGRLILTTVVVPENLDDLSALDAVARRFTDTLALSLPHPTGTDAARVYPKVAIPFTEVLLRIFPASGETVGQFSWGEIPVCVELAHERRAGVEVLTPTRFEHRLPAPSGTLYPHQRIAFESAGGNQVDLSPTVPCPHQDRCHAAPACARVVYRAYADRFGLDELAPVTRDDLAARAGGSDLLAAIEELTST